MKRPKLKILFMSADKFPPYRVDVSVLFGQEIVNKGHTIDWILQSEKPLKRSVEKCLYNGKAYVGSRSTGLSKFSRVGTLLSGVLQDLKVFSILKKRKYDLLIVKDKFLSGAVAVFAAKIFNVKLIYWLSFPFPEDSLFRAKEKVVPFPFLYWLRGFFFHILLYKFIMNFCDHSFVQTEYMKENVAGKGVSRTKMTSIPMAVSIKDIPFYGYDLNQLKNKRYPIVVYLGTLIKNRRMDFLLRSFKIVKKTFDDAKLYLVGGSEIPADEMALKQEAKRLKIEQSVIFTGFLPQSEAWKYVQDADVCVSPIFPSPSFDVGSPTKLLEYMAMGKASVANDHPEQKIVLAESKAGICVPYDEDAFADAILYMINNPLVASQMGSKGRKYVAEKRNYSDTATFVESTLIQISRLI